MVVWVGLGVALPRAAHAYPQFQLSHDQTCVGCHVSPAGGGLLTENGRNMAESISQLGHAPELFYGAWTPPSWLTLGGDFRVLGGLFATPVVAAAAVPMQGELYAHATSGNFQVHLTGGVRPAQTGNTLATRAWSREHYVTWQQHPDELSGLYVRVGRFMPVFGLRLAEHPTYTRRYGGTPLFAETYGAAVEYVSPEFEIHGTGFIRDRLIDPVVDDSGGALYAEARVTESAAVGVEAMATASVDDQKYRGGVTGKLFVARIATMLQGELIVTQQNIDDSVTVRSLTGSLLASRFLTPWLLVDLGLGLHDGNVAVLHDDRDGVDLNVHYFVDSHLELVFNGRYEALGLGQGGPSGWFAAVQAHYRL